MSSRNEIEIIQKGGLTIDEYNTLIDLRHDFYEYEKDNVNTTDIDPYVRLLQNKHIDPTSIIDLYTGYLITIAKRNDIDIDTEMTLV